MALAIKAIPTLYGDEVRRFRDMADEAERKFDMSPKLRQPSRQLHGIRSWQSRR